MVIVDGSTYTQAERIINIGLFMFMSKNPQPVSATQVPYMYNEEEISAELLAEQFFQNQNGLNNWLSESSYG